jgi:hypothetical protein
MQIIKAMGLDRKSGGAQSRDLCVDALSWSVFGRSWRTRALRYGHPSRILRKIL